MREFPKKPGEQQEEIKTLKYDQSLVALILSGEKDVTWRLFDDKDLKAGEIVNFMNKQTGEIFARAEIIATTEKSLGEIQETDFEGHERFESREAMLATYQGYYGDRVNWDTMVKIIKFKLIES